MKKTDRKNKFIINKRSCKNGIGSFFIVFDNVVLKETKGLLGVSHLCEHLLCNPIKSIEAEANSFGISFNAFTNYRFVSIFAEGLDENLSKFKTALLDCVFNYIPDQNTFEREKNVILSEYKMVMSDPKFEFERNFERKYYDDTSMIGYYEDINNLTYEKFLEFYKTYFSKPSFLVNLSKYKYENSNIDFYESDEKLYPKKFGLYNNYKTEHNTSGGQEIICMFKQFDKKIWSKNINNMVYFFVLSSYFSDGITTSPFVKDIREPLGIYSIYSSVQILLESDVILKVIGITDKDKSKSVEEGIEKCFDKHLSNLDENRFNYCVSLIKNQIKLQHLSRLNHEKLYSIINKNINKIDRFISRSNLNFEEFKSFCKNIFGSKEFICEHSSTI